MTDTVTPRVRKANPSQELLSLLRLRPSPSIRTVVAVAVAIVTAFALGAMLFGMTRERIYGAQVEVVFSPGADLSDNAVDRAMLTEEVILRSPAMLRPVGERTGTSVKALQDAISTEVVDQSNVLRITVRNRDRARAVALAGLIADQYQGRLTAGATGSEERLIAASQKLIERLSASLVRAQSRLDELAGSRDPRAAPSVTEQRAQAEVTRTVQQITVLQDGLKASQDRQLQATFLTRGEPLLRPLEPQPLRELAAGLLVGIFVAAGVALALLRRRSSTDFRLAPYRSSSIGGLSTPQPRPWAPPSSQSGSGGGRDATRRGASGGRGDANQTTA
jgi:capsular polysaccharide biosynthesis protein